MYNFLSVTCFVMAALVACAGGLTLVLNVGWEVGLGWLVWSAVFYKAGGFFHYYSTKG